MPTYHDVTLTFSPSLPGWPGVPLGGGHAFHEFRPDPDVYFEEHPEYFNYWKTDNQWHIGSRLDNAGQFNTTNCGFAPGYL